MTDARIFRTIVPVPDIDTGAQFYAALLDGPGERIAPDRHYYRCGEVILAIVEPGAHDRDEFRPIPLDLYLAVDDLDAMREHVDTLEDATVTDDTATRPWGERSFYIQDPWGNKLCFVDGTTLFTGGRFVE